MPEEEHADQYEDAENYIPDKVHPMDALTATKAVVFVIGIKTIPAHFHHTNQPRQKSSTEIHKPNIRFPWTQIACRHCA